jgi:two-component system, OmpR family, response regulator
MIFNIHVMLVDDDAEIIALTTDYLIKQGILVSCASSGARMWQLLAEDPPDMVVLDVMLGVEDGLALGREIRQRYPMLPMMMLSALSDDIDRVVGLEIGADDYLTKPFIPRELLARIRAILRRARTVPATQQTEQRRRFCEFGHWKLDRVERCLIAADGTVSELPAAEYALLSVFIENPGKAMSRDQLMNQLVGINCTFVDRSVDLRVSRLRHRLAESSDVEYIKTIRNEGYVFSKSVSFS